MRKIAVLLAAVVFLLPFSFVFASADYDGESASDYVMETSSGVSMVPPASQSDEISLDSVLALQNGTFSSDVSTADCYAAFEEWGFVPDQRVLESAVFYASAWALETYDVDLDYAVVTVGQTADNSAVSITQDSGGNVEVRFDADFLREYEMNGKRDNTLDSVIEGYQDAATTAVEEAVTALYNDGEGVKEVEGTALLQLNVPEEEASAGLSISTENLPDKFVQELQITAAAFAVENGLYSLENSAAEYFSTGSNPYKGITYSFASFADNVNFSYANLSNVKGSSGVGFNTSNGTVAVDPTYAVDMLNAFHNGYAAESVASYAEGLYSSWMTTVGTANNSGKTAAVEE